MFEETRTVERNAMFKDIGSALDTISGARIWAALALQVHLAGRGANAVRISR